MIPKAERDTANIFCNSIGAEGETFTVPLYTGTAHTHYICNWLVTETQGREIDAYFALVFDDADTALSSLGLTFKTSEGD